VERDQHTEQSLIISSGRMRARIVVERAASKIFISLIDINMRMSIEHSIVLNCFATTKIKKLFLEKTDLEELLRKIYESCSDVDSAKKFGCVLLER
jgi:hypothetical protein